MNVVAAFAPLLHGDVAGLSTAEDQAIDRPGSKVLVGKTLLPVFLFIAVRRAQLLAVDDHDGVHAGVAGFG